MFRKTIREVFIWGIWLLTGIFLSIYINSKILVHAHVLSGSMESTIKTDDRVFGLRYGYFNANHNRFDIIVFESPLPNEFDKPFIKRIIGLEGETVSVREGVVHINGMPIKENYIPEIMLTDFDDTTVPHEHLFVMGDNRNNSRDSREWGTIPKNSVIGRIYISFSPMPKIFSN